MAVAITFFATLYTTLLVGPVIEETIAPVLTDFKIQQVFEVEEGTLDVLVQYNKRRQCEFIGLNWFRVTADGSLIPVRTLMAPESNTSFNLTRPKGRQYAGPWRVHMSKTALYRSSLAEVYHKCHLLWITRTQIYP